MGHLMTVLVTDGSFGDHYLDRIRFILICQRWTHRRIARARFYDGNPLIFLMDYSDKPGLCV